MLMSLVLLALVGCSVAVETHDPEVVPVEGSTEAPAEVSAVVELSAEDSARTWCGTSGADCTAVVCAAQDGDGDGWTSCEAVTPSGPVALDCSLSTGCRYHVPVVSTAGPEQHPTE